MDPSQIGHEGLQEMGLGGFSEMIPISHPSHPQHPQYQQQLQQQQLQQQYQQYQMQQLYQQQLQQQQLQQQQLQQQQQQQLQQAQYQQYQQQLQQQQLQQQQQQLLLQQQQQQHSGAAGAAATQSSAAAAAASADTSDVQAKALALLRRTTVKSGKKPPYSGYVLYMSMHRDRLKMHHPDMAFQDVTKALANEWGALSQADKQTYIDAVKHAKEVAREMTGEELADDDFADIDPDDETARKRVRVAQGAAPRTLNVKHTDPNVEGDLSGTGLYCQPCHQFFANIYTMREHMVSKKHTQLSHNGTPTSQEVSMQVPIFTKEFITHNKGREEEIRLLLRANAQLEKQNQALHSRAEVLADFVQKLADQAVELQKTTKERNERLAALRVALVEELSAPALLLPNQVAPNVSTIDDYLGFLSAHLTTLEASHALRAAVEHAVQAASAKVAAAF